MSASCALIPTATTYQGPNVWQCSGPALAVHCGAACHRSPHHAGWRLTGAATPEGIGEGPSPHTTQIFHMYRTVLAALTCLEVGVGK